MIHLQWQYTSGVFYEIPTKYLVPFYCFVSLDFSFWNCAQFIANAKHNRNVLVAEQWFGILNTMYCRWRDFNPGFGERLANFFSFSWLISYSILETKRLNIRINIILQRATHPVAIRQIFHVKSVARTRLIQQYCTQKHSQTHTHTLLPLVTDTMNSNQFDTMHSNRANKQIAILSALWSILSTGCACVVWRWKMDPTLISNIDSKPFLRTKKKHFK